MVQKPLSNELLYMHPMNRAVLGEQLNPSSGLLGPSVTPTGYGGGNTHIHTKNLNNHAVQLTIFM
jgi:hypothetical protein